MNITDLDRQLAALKKEWEKQSDPTIKAQLSAAATKLREQGAREVVANQMVYNSITGAGSQYMNYMPEGFNAGEQYAQSLVPLPKAPTAAPPTVQQPSMSAEALSLLEQIRAQATNMPTAEDIMRSTQYKSLVDAVQSRRDDEMRQANAQLAARGVLGEGSTPAASRIGWVYADAARKEQELIPALLQAETARQQASYNNLINALGAQMGAEGQMWGQGLQKFQAETPYVALTKAQQADVDQNALDYQRWRAEQTGVMDDGTLTLEGRNQVLREKAFDAEQAIAEAKKNAGITGPVTTKTDPKVLTAYLEALNYEHKTLLDNLTTIEAKEGTGGEAYKAALAELQRIEVEMASTRNTISAALNVIKVPTLGGGGGSTTPPPGGTTPPPTGNTTVVPVGGGTIPAPVVTPTQPGTAPEGWEWIPDGAGGFVLRRKSGQI